MIETACKSQHLRTLPPGTETKKSTLSTLDSGATSKAEPMRTFQALTGAFALAQQLPQP
jgi:hypothetical protein